MTSLIIAPPHNSFLSAQSCPVLVLHSDLQPFHIIIVELEQYLVQILFFFCLHMFTKLFNSDSICYNQCSGTVLGAFFTRAKLLLPRTSFSFVYLFLLSSVCLFLQKTLVYIYSFSLSVYTVFDVSYLLTLLEHKLSCLSGLLIAFCAVPVQHYLISVLITEAQFDF